MKQNPTYRVVVMRGNHKIIDVDVESSAPEWLTNQDAIVAYAYRQKQRKFVASKDRVFIAQRLYKINETETRYTDLYPYRYYGAP